MPSRWQRLVMRLLPWFSAETEAERERTTKARTERADRAIESYRRESDALKRKPAR